VTWAAYIATRVALVARNIWHWPPEGLATTEVDSQPRGPFCKKKLREHITLVDALLVRCANPEVIHREWPVSHALARPHGLSLINLEHNLKF
jgi:hypothetical protein